MANCVSCGRELPSFSFGEQSELCPECRQALPPPAPAPRRARRRPPITIALIGINVAVYIVMAASGVSPLDPSTAQLLKWGANWGPLSLGSQPWRIITSNYVHGGLIHIALNMWCLWNLGFLAEQVFDTWTYILAYTACGIGGSLASQWLHPMRISVGASGAIFGLAGALIAALYLGHLPIPRQALRGTLKSLVMFAGYNLFFGAVVPAIDNSAHIGGLVTGLLLGAVLAKRLFVSAKSRHAWRVAVFTGAAVLLFSAFTYVRHVNAYVVQMENGMQALQRNDHRGAVRALEAANALKPNQAGTMSLLSDAYIAEEDFPKAESALQQYLQKTPDDQRAWFNLGLVEKKLGHFDQAITTLKHATELSPDDADARQALGEAYAANNMLEDAQSSFVEAARLRNKSR